MVEEINEGNMRGGIFIYKKKWTKIHEDVNEKKKKNN